MKALADFVERTLGITENGVIAAPFDPDWRSPCERYQDQDHTWWSPVPQSPGVDFAGLEHALELTLHPDIRSYYTCFWSGTLEADSEEGPVSLIQLWNPDDFERLVANLIGHALNTRRARSPFTVFFANTDPDSELFLSIDNESGRILLEEPGRAPIREVDGSLTSFLNRLTPSSRTSDLF